MSQFKVGDWVCTHPGTHSAQLGPIFQIDEFSRYRADEVYLWTPSIGEWCWFWEDNSLDDYPRLGLYGHMSWSLKYWDHCEPFIGTLPTGAK